MPRSDDLFTLPPDLPVPVDDGACDDLPGARLPALGLPSTDGGVVDLSTLPGRTVVFCYPRTGTPDRDPPPGWDLVPGARGCTPQACGYRDLHGAFAARDVRVFGLSTQDTAYQREAATRLHLPFPLLSDERLAFARALNLPTWTIAGHRLVRRLTLVVRDGAVETVFYPVFPPDRSAATVLDWLASRP